MIFDIMHKPMQSEMILRCGGILDLPTSLRLIGRDI